MFDIFALLLLIVVVFFVRQFPPLKPAYGMTFNLGFVLIASYFFGLASARVKLPRVSGYIIAGILFGPYVLNLLGPDDIEGLRLIDGLALALIALIAGGELRMKQISAQWKGIVSVLVFQVSLVFAGMFLLVLLFQNFIPLTRSLPLAGVVTVGLLLGVTAVAKSPATTIAIINEYRARGPMTDLVLGVTILKDVIVLLVFAVVLSVSEMLMKPGQRFDTAFMLKLGSEIGFSLLWGAALGGIYILYLKKIKAESEVFLLLSVLLVAEFAPAFHLEPMLLCIAAGFVVQNFSRQGEHFIEAIERSMLPVLVLFFSIAGASLNLEALFGMWHLAILLVLFRLAFTWAGTYVGIRMAGGSPAIERYGWTGFVAQAGVTLGMAILIEKSFPEWGEQLKTLIVAAIALNQIAGPVFFRFGLLKAGETAENRTVQAA